MALEYPSQTFVHQGYKFRISWAQEGDHLALHISDRYGRILLPLALRVARADVERDGKLDRRPIVAAMAELRKVIKELDQVRFKSLVNAPRQAGEFEWTAEEREAASRINWSQPVATIDHEGFSFSIGAFETEKRMVVLLRDAHGLFDAPVSIPRDSMVRAVMEGTDPLAMGVTAMMWRIRSWNASGVAAFIKATPRLDVSMKRQTKH